MAEKRNGLSRRSFGQTAAGAMAAAPLLASAQAQGQAGADYDLSTAMVLRTRRAARSNRHGPKHHSPGTTGTLPVAADHDAGEDQQEPQVYQHFTQPLQPLAPIKEPVDRAEQQACHHQPGEHHQGMDPEGCGPGPGTFQFEPDCERIVVEGAEQIAAPVGVQRAVEGGQPRAVDAVRRVVVHFAA